MADLQPLQDERRRKRNDEGGSNAGALVAGGAAVVTTLAIIAAFAGGGKKKGKKPGAPSPGASDPGPGGAGDPGLGLGQGLPKEPVIDFQPGKLAGVWSLGMNNGSICGAPYIPAATADYGRLVRDIGGGGLVWGWTPPGDMRVPLKFGRRLIADVESRSSTKARPEAGWTGDELGLTKQLAPMCHGVTSHGFVPEHLRSIFIQWAKAGGVAYPQVYDSDRSTPSNTGGARGFLRHCVNTYKGVGFTRICPLLGNSAGPAILSEWIDECRVLGLPFMIWSLQSLDDYGIECGMLV